MNKLSKRNKRALVGIGAALLFYLVVDHVALPFFDLQQQVGQEIELKERSLLVAQHSIGQESLYQTRLADVEQVVAEYQRRLLEAKDPASAGVQLEGLVRGLAAQNGVRVSRSNPIPEKKIGEKYAKISLQMNLECDLDSLIHFLHAVSTHDKFLLTEDFNLASFRVRDETRIQPRLQISAFIRLS